MHPLLDLAARPVIGHRGNAAHAPENTLASFRSAVALGVDALELDVHLTADGRVVVHHDPTALRTSGAPNVIAASTLADLRQLDAGARFTRDGGATFPFRERDVRIPTLDELLEAFPDLPLLIEIKTPAASRATRALIERFGATERVIVDAFDAACLTPFRGSTIAVGSSRSDIVALMARAACGVAPKAVPYATVCVPVRHGAIPIPVGRFARMLAPLGVPVHVWTVNDPAVALSLWRAGVRGIISDDPGAMIAAGATIRHAVQ
jgi:glycerophosphoryl diester phosphodiesterase